jgi:hypothetical protein
MIGNDVVMPMPMNRSMEIMENKEPREIKPGVPERAGDPGVQEIIIPGRGIIGDDRRAFGVVITIDFGGRHVLWSCRRRAFTVWTGTLSPFSPLSNDRQLLFYRNRSQYL